MRSLGLFLNMGASSSSSSAIVTDNGTSSTTITIPPQLDFFTANVKTLITIQLTTDNHLLWKSQLLNLFATNNYERYLTGSTP